MYNYSILLVDRGYATYASSIPYKHIFTYSPIGNMTGMATTGATTTYTYSETGSTNPSAPTAIGSGSLTYDTNGNLTAYNATKYTWDYRNRVTTIGNGTATTTFAYDHTFERVKKVSGGVTTYYINDLYNKAGATTTIYIYDNTGTLLATIEGNGTATTTQYQHQDHLGGTNVITNALANVVTTMDYYPYGDTRIQSGTFTSKRNFIGEVSDAETDLNYLNARYYDSNRGQFVSQDPVFWEVGERSKWGQSRSKWGQSRLFCTNTHEIIKSCPVLLALISKIRFITSSTVQMVDRGYLRKILTTFSLKSF